MQTHNSLRAKFGLTPLSAEVVAAGAVVAEETIEGDIGFLKRWFAWSCHVQNANEELAIPVGARSHCRNSRPKSQNRFATGKIFKYRKLQFRPITAVTYKYMLHFVNARNK